LAGTSSLPVASIADLETIDEIPAADVATAKKE
jgi:hypothetical protein